jgi:hypothetical protein
MFGRRTVIDSAARCFHTFSIVVVVTEIALTKSVSTSAVSGTIVTATFTAVVSSPHSHAHAGTVQAITVIGTVVKTLPDLESRLISKFIVFSDDHVKNTTIE